MSQIQKVSSDSGGDVLNDLTDREFQSLKNQASDQGSIESDSVDDELGDKQIIMCEYYDSCGSLGNTRYDDDGCNISQTQHHHYTKLHCPYFKHGTPRIIHLAKSTTPSNN